MPMKCWRLRGQTETMPVQQDGLTALASQVLASRGYDTKEKMAQFLSGQQQMSDPFLLKDMDKAVERIRRALDNGERIAVYGDYDCDGMMSTVLLYRYFETVGADVCYYIPQREKEGYGLNREALRLIQKDGVTLVVTVDNGVTAVDEITYANRLGLDVVVTDHHKPRETLPDAVAVVDPHREDDESGCCCLAGVGVAFKLICALEGGDCDWMLDQYGDLVTVATIGDIVPLIGENRLIVRRGLEVLRETENEGLAALMQVCNLSDRALGSESVAFGLVPRINAAGRFDRVDDAIELFLGDAERAGELAQEINALNDLRRSTEEVILAQILEHLEADRQPLDRRILVVCGDHWHHGVIGIVASKLTDRFGKPCVVLSREGEEVRGSARSVDGFSIIDAIDACGDLLTRYGGHDQAAGLSLCSNQVTAFIDRINEWACAHFQQMPQAVLEIDCTIATSLLTVEQAQGLSVLEPFGAGNDLPVFRLCGCTLQGIYPIGEGKHLRLRFCGDGVVFYAVYFGMTPDAFAYTVGQNLDLAVTLDANEWNGELRLSVKIRDLRLSGVDYDLFYASEQLYRQLMRKEPCDAGDREIPTRDDIAVVYRFLRAKGGWNFSDETLCLQLDGQISSLCKLKLSLDVLGEMQLITGRSALGGKLALVPNPGKVNISSSKILQGLRA